MVLIVGALVFTLSSPLLDILSVPDNYSDARADWIVTKAFISGLDPYADIRTLADQFGVEYVNPGLGEVLSHPRTPGALLLQTPMAWFDIDTATALVILTGVASLMAMVIWLTVHFLSLIHI